MQALVAAGTRRHHRRRQELGPPRDGGPRRLARRKRADDRRLGRASSAANVAEVVYDAEHFFDGYKHNPDYALRTLRAAADSGARWIVLCDTNGGTLPEEVAAAVAEVRKRFDVPDRHPRPQRRRTGRRQHPGRRPHGATQVQGTINGIGERCGNVDLCSVIANLALEISRLRASPPRQPRPADRGLAVRLRDGQHELPPRPAVRRLQRLRPQGRDARPRRPQGRAAATSTSTRPSSATSGGSSSASSRASRTSPRSSASTASATTPR